MPRTLGDSLIHVYDIDVLVPTDRPILEISPPKWTTPRDRSPKSIRLD